MSLTTNSTENADCTSGNDASPTFGSRLLPSVLDQWARDEPARLYAMIPHAEDSSESFDGVTMLQMSYAVDVTAWWLTKAFGAGGSPQRLAYIGVSDLRYPIVHLATMKIGWLLILLATRNTVSQNLNILERTECTRILYGAEIHSKIQALHSGADNLICTAFVSLRELLAMEPRPFPYDKDFQQAKNEPALVIHTTGTTGDPNLVTMTHGTFSATDLDRSMPTPPGRRAQNAALFSFPGGGKVYSCFPPYHLAGLQAFTILPVFYGSTAVFGPSGMPASGHLLSEIMRHLEVKAIYVPPAIIESWIRLHGALEQAAKLDFVLYGGGSLSPETGNILDEVCNLFQMYGSTEIGPVQLLVPLKGDWAHLEVNPYEKIDMQRSEQHGAYEMVLHQDTALNHRRLSYHNFPESEEWRTGDLFLPVPGKPGLWDFYGRVDDLIILSNSYKVNPVTMETHVQGHPLVRGALIIGIGRPNPAIIIELVEEAMGQSRNWQIESIWPTIETANRSVPGYGHILRSMVLFSKAEKPFIRSPKGSIVRKLNLKQYAEEIDGLYSSQIAAESVIPDTCAEEPHSLYSGLTAAESVVPDTIKDMVLRTIRQFVRRGIKPLLPKIEVSDTQNLFHSGLDSLKIIELRNFVQDGFRTAGSCARPAFALDTIYEHPTIASLAQAIFFILIQSSNGLKPSDHLGPRNLIDKYTNDLGKEETSESIMNVLMTGSTGTLGRSILNTLLEDSRVSTIYCLGRHPNGRESQAHIFRNEDDDACVDMTKVQFLCVNLGEEQLGLTDKIWQELASTVHVIIHTAWKVDFSLPLSHFESDHIRGLRSLIDLSRDGRHRPRIAFTSSSSTMAKWHSAQGTIPVPESLANDHETALQMGYSQSKFVAEHILGIANDKCNVPVTIFRIGQIAGAICDPPRGQWPPHELVSLIMRTSKSIGLLPMFNAYCDWIPVDMIARIMHEILFPAKQKESGIISNPSGNPAEVYNVVNPHPIHWSLLCDILKQHLGDEVRVVPLAEWIEVLKVDKAEGLGTTAPRPALKMLPFLETLAANDSGKENGYLSFETAKGVRDSKTMSRLEPVNENWINVWIKQWGI